MRVKSRVIAAAVLLTVMLSAAFFLRSALPLQKGLYLKNPDTGAVFLRIPVSCGDEFSIEFIHSVNKTPYRDVYTVRGDGLYLSRGEYYGFGAGVPSTDGDGKKVTVGSDGVITVSGSDVCSEKAVYRVSLYSDDILIINGKKISLRALCGKGAAVELSTANYTK